MDCEHYEVEIEKRRHGALSAEDSATVDRHLESCASCRAFDHTITQLETAMHANTTLETSNVDWSRVERGLAAMATSYRRTLPLSILGYAALTAVTTWASEPDMRSATALFFTAIAGAVFALSLVVRRRTAARLRALGDHSAELLAAYRKELDLIIERERLGRWFLPALAVPFIVGVRELIAGGRGANAAFWIIFGTLMVGQAVLARRERGRAERARSELG